MAKVWEHEGTVRAGKQITTTKGELDGPGVSKLVAAVFVFIYMY
jgi:hypothetical protein